MQEVGKKHCFLSGEMWDVAMPAGDVGRTCGFFFWRCGCGSDHRVVELGVCACAPTIVSWRCRPEMPAGDVFFFVKYMQVPRDP